jgi:hypothetical protein
MSFLMDEVNQKDLESATNDVDLPSFSESISTANELQNSLSLNISSNNTKQKYRIKIDYNKDEIIQEELDRVSSLNNTINKLSHFPSYEKGCEAAVKHRMLQDELENYLKINQQHTSDQMTEILNQIEFSAFETDRLKREHAQENIQMVHLILLLALTNYNITTNITTDVKLLEKLSKNDFEFSSHFFKLMVRLWF